MSVHATDVGEGTLIPELLARFPGAREVLDRYGLRGCGGPSGPVESLGFFARAHDVPLARLLDEIRRAGSLPRTLAETAAAVSLADTIYRPFFFAGIATVLTLGAVWGAYLLLQIGLHGTFRAAGLHEINAHGHAQIFGWVVIAFFFYRLGLLRPAFAAHAALLSATIFLAGGIIGTCHHLYFSGTPTVALAWGSVFSALEVVPLTLVAYGAMDDLALARAMPWVERYRWPIYFFVSVAFWNMMGAGLFGFMINPPIALYYMQGLNTTPVHGHAALFGVYGMLGIGLMLVCLRALVPDLRWNERWLWFSFWGMNVGLFAMCVGSLLPVGLLQTWASVDQGYWYARSGKFMNTPLMQTLRWMRVPGDTLFALGALALVVFVAGIRQMPSQAAVR